MGFWNDGIRTESPSRNRSRSRTRTQSSSHHNSSSQHHERKESPKYYAVRPAGSRSVSSFFSNMGGGGGSSTSRGRSYSSRAKPRSGFIARIRKWLRELYSYMRRHPVKVFFLVIMPLITGGALTKILAQFGVRLPAGLQQLAGSSQFRNMAGGSERNYARGGARDFGGGTALPGMLGGVLSGASGGGLSSGTLQSAMNIAKMFM